MTQFGRFPYYSFLLTDRQGNVKLNAAYVMDRVLSFKLNGMDSVAFNAILSDNETVRFLYPGCRLQVWRQETVSSEKKLIFYGYLPSENIDDDTENDIRSVTFVSPVYVLNNRNILGTEGPTNNGKFTGSTAGAIFTALIDAQNAREGGWGETYITPSVTGTTESMTREYKDRSKVIDLINELTIQNNKADYLMEYRDDLPGKMGYLKMIAPRAGTEKKDTVLFFGDNTISTISWVKKSYHPQKNLIITQGANKTEKNMTSKSIVGSQPWLLMEEFVAWPDDTTQAALDDNSAKILDRKKRLMPIYEIGELISGLAPRPWTDFYLGDSLLLYIKFGGLDNSNQGGEMVRVQEINIDLRDGGNEIVNLKVANPDFDDD